MTKELSDAIQAILRAPLHYNMSTARKPGYECAPSVYCDACEKPNLAEFVSSDATPEADLCTECYERHAIVRLSQDGPMGLTNVLFIGAVWGCAVDHQIHEACAELVANIMNEHKDRGRGYSGVYARIVQAVIDGQIDDPICATLFEGARVLQIGADSYDFELRTAAVSASTESEELHERRARAMQRLFE